MYMSSSDLIASERKLFFLYIHVQMHVKCTCISIHVHLQCMYCSLIRFYQVIDEINSNQLLFPISFFNSFLFKCKKDECLHVNLSHYYSLMQKLKIIYIYLQQIFFLNPSLPTLEVTFTLSVTFKHQK